MMDERDVERVRRRLKAADPATLDESSESESLDRIAARLAATELPARRRASYLAPLATVAVLLAIALLTPMLREGRTPPVVATADSPERMAAPHEERIERRQLQFETPGGTRLILILDPAFNLNLQP